MVYYNEHEPFCVAWLRRLIAAGQLPPQVAAAFIAAAVDALNEGNV